MGNRRIRANFMGAGCENVTHSLQRLERMLAVSALKNVEFKIVLGRRIKLAVEIL
ncbi:MAG TPA: hypothetical protein VJN92_20265 [Candidatus Acidoferrum sp.]|nr:hypothetical protein [Candidatus Acidoferrum sp.]